jgi:hypothetical protein
MATKYMLQTWVTQVCCNAVTTLPLPLSNHVFVCDVAGFMLVRNGELAYMSPQQQHEFNFPYQIGSADSMADSPAAAQRFSLDVREGDVIVAATDGLFDNVYPDEAAALVSGDEVHLWALTATPNS